MGMLFAILLAGTVYHYDPVTGRCPGMNPFDPQTLVGDGAKTAECVDFGGYDFKTNLHTGGSLAMARLNDWNFRGAVFDRCDLRFVSLRDADVSGASFKGARLGYTVIDGKADQFTKIDPSCPVPATAGAVSCRF